MKVPLLYRFPLLLSLLFAAPLSAQVAGTLENAFNPGGKTSYVTLTQPDGRILMAGDFSTVGGQPRESIARLLADGTVEPLATFDTGNFRAAINCMAVQDDGKILVAGEGTVARLLPDGSRELPFLSTGVDGFEDSEVYAMAVQPDGKILLGGWFARYNYQPAKCLARLNPDGTLESTATFNTGTGPNSEIGALALQPDGKILIAGGFTTFNGQPRHGLARLLPNGALEDTATFNPGSGPDVKAISSIVVQPDGKILAGGSFRFFDDQPRASLARLHPDGSLESTDTFNPGSGISVYDVPSIYDMTLQVDGKILIGGEFTTINRQPRRNLARLRPDGSLEPLTAFDGGAGPTGLDHGQVYSLVLQSNGRILVGGEFNKYNGVPRAGMARLANDPAADNLTVTPQGHVQWLRSGSGPEALRVSFALSGPEGWTEFGAGTRIAGGWELTGLPLPASGTVRVRARTWSNGGSGLVESTTAYMLPLAAWRQTYFGTPNPAGDAADNADPDGDGLPNLVEFAFGRHPLLSDAALLPQWTRVAGGLELNFTEPPGREGISWHVEHSDSLAPASWTEIPNTAIAPA